MKEKEPEVNGGNNGKVAQKATVEENAQTLMQEQKVQSKSKGKAPTMRRSA
jgi:hypothetical protein